MEWVNITFSVTWLEYVILLKKFARVTERPGGKGIIPRWLLPWIWGSRGKLHKEPLCTQNSGRDKFYVINNSWLGNWARGILGGLAVSWRGSNVKVPLAVFVAWTYLSLLHACDAISVSISLSVVWIFNTFKLVSVSRSCTASIYGKLIASAWPSQTRLQTVICTHQAR